MSTPEDCHTLQAIYEGVEAARKDAEAEWGLDRLPMLVDDLTRAKVHSQTAKWSRAIQEAMAAINANRPVTRDHMQAVTDTAEAMKRMWGRLPEMASEAGHRPLHVDALLEGRTQDGAAFVVVRTAAEASHVIASGRCLRVFTVEEIGHLLDAMPEMLGLAKVHFPGATVLPAKPIDWKTGDDIPFGEVA